MNKREFKGYWHNYVSRIAEMAESSSFAFPIWVLSFMMAVWGLWLVLPLGTFEGVPYYRMMSFASEMAWGVVAMGLGIGKMHFVTVKKTISLSILSLVSGYFWMLVGVAFLLAIPSNTGGVAYMFLGLLEIWFYKRLQSRTHR